MDDPHPERVKSNAYHYQKAAGGRSGIVSPVLYRRIFAGRDRGDEGRVAEHDLQEAPQDQKAADRDVQEGSIRPERAVPIEYGDKWRREIFLPLLMIGY